MKLTGNFHLINLGKERVRGEKERERERGRKIRHPLCFFVAVDFERIVPDMANNYGFMDHSDRYGSSYFVGLPNINGQKDHHNHEASAGFGQAYMPRDIQNDGKSSHVDSNAGLLDKAEKDQALRDREPFRYCRWITERPKMFLGKINVTCLLIKIPHCCG